MNIRVTVKYKSNFFYKLVCRAAPSGGARGVQHPGGRPWGRQIPALQNFQILNNIYPLVELNRDDKLRYCLDLQIKLSDSERKEPEIKVLDLCDEIELLLTYTRPDMNALTVFGYIFKNDPAAMFSNITIALRIFLTIPVTVASGESSFSKLKLIKNYLKSSMSQERLTYLS